MRHVALRSPVTRGRKWVRIHPNMQPAFVAMCKREGIKGVRYTADDGEIIVSYPDDWNALTDHFLDLFNDLRRVRAAA